MSENKRTEWYCEVLGEVLGPMGSKQLQEMVRRKELSPHDQVRRSGSNKWLPAGEIRGLFSQPAAAAAKPKEATAVDRPTAKPVTPEISEAATEPETAVGWRVIVLAGCGCAAVALALLLWFGRGNEQLRAATSGKEKRELAELREKVRQLKAQEAADTAKAADSSPTEPATVPIGDNAAEASSAEEDAPTPPGSSDPPAAENPAETKSATGLELPVLVKLVEPSVVTIEKRRLDGTLATGSGFLTGSHGLVATNFHVANEAVDIKVLLVGGSVYSATGFVAASAEHDLAVLHVPDLPPDLARLELASDVEKGERVAAFGSPQGLIASVSDGVVSSVRTGHEIAASGLLETAEIYTAAGYALDARWIHSTATIDHGNSGGPLVNYRGRVVGVNTWAPKDATGYYFAISSEHLAELLASAPAQPSPLEHFPHRPRPNVPAQAPPARDEEGEIAIRIEQRRRLLQSIYEQRLTLLQRYENLQSKVYDIRNQGEAAKANLTGVEGRMLAVNSSLSEADAQLLQHRRRDENFEANQVQSEMRNLQLQLQALQAEHASLTQRIAELLRRHAEALAAERELLLECNQLRHEWLTAVGYYLALTHQEIDAVLMILNEWAVLDTANPMPYVNRGLIKWHRGDLDAALLDLQHAVDLAGVDLTSSLAARGAVRVMLGDERGGMRDFGQALKVNERDADIYWLRARVYQSQGRYPLAERDIKTGLRLAADHRELLRMQALLLAACPQARFRNGTKAIVAARKLLEVTGEQDWQSVAILAAAHAEAGDFQQAAALAEQAADLTFAELRAHCLTMRDAFLREQTLDKIDW
ncbi:MAG: trypsin-like peptidase domain-containing protein [Pirellulales bacterium]|nr:trypsin-like peptidase domain-containing protein [Pirellulales bacterium]